MAGEGEEATPTRQRVAAGMAHLDRDIDVAEQGARTARRLADRPIPFSGMVQQEDGHGAAREGTERQERFQHALGTVFAAQEGGQRVDRYLQRRDEEGEASPPPDRSDATAPSRIS